MKSLLFSLLTISGALVVPLSVGAEKVNNNTLVSQRTPVGQSLVANSSDCANLHGKGLRVCSTVYAADKAVDGARCDEAICKLQCCHAAKECRKSHFLSLTSEECIYSHLQRTMGSCCIVGKSSGATMVYAGGAVVGMIIVSGLYFIVSMGSHKKVIKGEKPTDDDEKEDAKLYETKTPHMDVNQLIATDGDDVFWED
ncbi:multidrug transporter [Babesia ovata]|uniref:Multidrug transporter n=1 Tax=Babesia ovata TaxID=189622 RepID=A0A2H6K879_9APIC|nr:multidrug transporter [Babesia ovata]GBE59203.1 multidrug transporter [Babesia ovata]